MRTGVPGSSPAPVFRIDSFPFILRRPDADSRAITYSTFACVSLPPHSTILRAAAHKDSTISLRVSGALILSIENHSGNPSRLVSGSNGALVTLLWVPDQRV